MITSSDHSDILAVMRDLGRIHKAAKVAGQAGLQAMDRLASRLVAGGLHSGQPYKIRAILFSVYSCGGEKADISDLRALDWDLREMVCAVLLGVNCPGFDDYEVREAFRRAGGESAVEWFTEEFHIQHPDVPRE